MGHDKITSQTQLYQWRTNLVIENLYNTDGENFWDDSKLDYKRDTSEVWGIGILIVTCSCYIWGDKRSN